MDRIGRVERVCQGIKGSNKSDIVANFWEKRGLILLDAKHEMCEGGYIRLGVLRRTLPKGKNTDLVVEIA